MSANWARRGQVENVGVLLLTVIVVLSVGVFSAFYLSSMTEPETQPAATDLAVVAVNESGTTAVTVTNTGGEAMTEGLVIVQSEGARYRLPSPFGAGDAWKASFTGHPAGSQLRIVVVENATSSVVFDSRVIVRQAEAVGTLAPEPEETADTDSTPPVVVVDRPTAGETVAAEDEYRLEWSASDAETSVNGIDIEVSTDDGATWSPVVTGTANDGSHMWTVPDVDTDEARIRVNAVDEGGNTARATTATFSISPSGGPPTADAGPSQSVPGRDGASVSLDGSGSSDPDDDTLSYGWTITEYNGTSGKVTLENATTATPTFVVTANVSGNHTVTAELTVDDGDTETEADTDTVNVSVYNTPPEADAGGDASVGGSADVGAPLLSGGGGVGLDSDRRFAVVPPRTGLGAGALGLVDSAMLDGTDSSDPDGDTLSYEWNIVDTDGLGSNTIELQSATSAEPTVQLSNAIFDRDHAVTVELTVRDGRGGVDTDTVEVIVLRQTDTENPTIEDVTLVADETRTTGGGLFGTQSALDLTYDITASDDADLESVEVTATRLFFGVFPFGTFPSPAASATVTGTEDNATIRVTEPSYSGISTYRIEITVTDVRGKETTTTRIYRV